MFSRKKAPARVLINGFGRIGRLVCRAAWGEDELEVVHINEPAGDAPTNAHLWQFDSVYGVWGRGVTSDGEAILADGKRVGFSQGSDLASIPIKSGGVDLVFECSGMFRRAPQLGSYFERGVSKVIVAAPMKEGGANVVLGVNDGAVDFRAQSIVSATSGAANCAAVAVKVVHGAFGIARGSFTAIHNLTNSQTVVDHVQKDPRRARAAGLSLIPTTTRAATVVPELFPELRGRINGNAVRVPLQSASLMDCAFELERPVSVEEVNAAFRASAEGGLKGLVRVEERPLVSVDYRGERCSCVVDALSTMVVDNTHLKLYLWYDNEMAFAHRMVELAKKAWAAQQGAG